MRQSIFVPLFAFTLLFVLFENRSVADDSETLSTDNYFLRMKQYLGSDGFAQHKCLAQQEQHGWVTSEKSKPFEVFNLGIEGTGHHAIESLLDPGALNKTSQLFSTIKSNGGQFSIPTGWRRAHATTKPKTHPDIQALVDSGTLIIVLLRYPPSALLSSINRFQNRSEEKGKKRINGVDEVYTLHDSLLAVDSVLRYPYFDCGRLLLVPFELLQQHPMTLLGPLHQALHLSSLGSRGLQILTARLEEMQKFEKGRAANGQTRYLIKEQVCTELDLSNGGPGQIHDRRLTTSTNGQIKAQYAGDNIIHNRTLKNKLAPCADRIYDFAQRYFDSRNFMFEKIYPSKEIIETSSLNHPRLGLFFSDL
jgi:hypothetical protein